MDNLFDFLFVGYKLLLRIRYFEFRVELAMTRQETRDNVMKALIPIAGRNPATPCGGLGLVSSPLCAPCDLRDPWGAFFCITLYFILDTLYFLNVFPRKTTNFRRSS